MDNLDSRHVSDIVNKNTVIIGIDFGTTFSGVSWAFSGQPNNVEVITQWPSEFNFNSDNEKTPSTLFYRGFNDETLWGYNIPAGNAEESLKWFKLLLIDAKDLSGELRRSRQMILAKRLLIEANRDTVEADGDHFVVCDAGGGTVDLISYEVITTSPMVVKEAVKGNGRLCGGVFLDQAFIELMRRLVGPHAWDALPKDDVRKLLNDDWEHGIKKQFYGQQKDWIVNLPPGFQTENRSNAMSRKNSLILGHKELDPVFRKIARQVEELVTEQMQEIRRKYAKVPKYIILVGGFGRCTYLFHHLVQETATDGTEVLQAQGSRPWSAICRGAVMRGLTRLKPATDLEVSVQSRIARVSYGTVFKQAYDPHYHLSVDKIWDEFEMKWMARNQVKWYLKQGNDIYDTKAVSHNYYRLYEKPPKEIIEMLYYSASSPAPEHDGIMDWLRGFENENVSELSLCEAAYRARNDEELRLVEQLGQESEDVADVTKTAPAFRTVKHMVGRLAAYVRAVSQLLDDGSRLRKLLTDYRVVNTVECPVSAPVPEADAHTTLHGALKRLLPNKDDRYQPYLDFLTLLNSQILIESKLHEKFERGGLEPKVHAEVQMLHHFHGVERQIINSVIGDLNSMVLDQIAELRISRHHHHDTLTQITASQVGLEDESDSEMETFGDIHDVDIPGNRLGLDVPADLQSFSMGVEDNSDSEKETGNGAALLNE
ncbi:hypothetical protein QIS74_13643 [Colletotrichum tabaci]|uniref:Hsp70 family chaperone n=1 Tax=Colletotrichum tabaci TaxID=1209068 RepID=A0AAV9SS02_9PEZI